MSKVSDKLYLHLSIFPSGLGTECIFFFVVLKKTIYFEVQSVLLPAPTVDDKKL